MPKTKLCEHVQELKNPKCDRAYRAIVAQKLAYKGLLKKDAYGLLGMCKSTYEMRQRNPETMTVAELRRMARVLEFTAEDVCQLLDIKLKS